MKRLCSGVSPLDLLEERESILYLLAQTTPERLHKNIAGYTIDPKTRYPNLNELVAPGDLSHLYDSDTVVPAKVADKDHAKSTRHDQSAGEAYWCVSNPCSCIPLVSDCNFHAGDQIVN